MGLFLLDVVDIREAHSFPLYHVSHQRNPTIKDVAFKICGECLQIQSGGWSEPVAPQPLHHPRCRRQWRVGRVFVRTLPRGWSSFSQAFWHLVGWIQFELYGYRTVAQDPAVQGCEGIHKDKGSCPAELGQALNAFVNGPSIPERVPGRQDPGCKCPAFARAKPRRRTEAPGGLG